MGYISRIIEGGETSYACDDCPEVMWDEGDILIHVDIWHNAKPLVKPMNGEKITDYVVRAEREIQASVADRMERAGREIRELHEDIDRVLATLNGGKSAQEAAYQRGRNEALKDAYALLVSEGYADAASALDGSI